MKPLAALLCMCSLAGADSTPPRADSNGSAARGAARASTADDAKTLEGAPLSSGLHARRLVGPRSLDELCRGATCLTLVRDDDAVPPFLDARLIADRARGTMRLALQTARGWFLDEQSIPPPRDSRPVALHRGASGVFVLVSGWARDAAAPGRDLGDCEQLVIACAVDRAGRPVCAPGLRAAEDPTCGTDERTMLDWGPSPSVD